MERFNTGVKNTFSTLKLDNEYVSAIIIVFLVVYASMAAPRLPESVAKLFEKDVFRFVVFFAVAYLAKQNATVAVVAALALLVTLQAVNRLTMEREMRTMVENSMAMRPEPEQAPVEFQQDPNDYRNNFYPAKVEEPVENLDRPMSDEVTGYNEDSLFANFDE